MAETTKLYKGQDVMEIPEFDVDYWKRQGWNTGTQTTPNQDLHIGATNWANLQKQYSPSVLSQATQNIGGDIYWNPNVNIQDLVNKGMNIEEITSTPNITPKVETVSVDNLMAGIDTSNKGLKAQLDQLMLPTQSQARKEQIDEQYKTETEAQRTAQRDLQEEQWERFGLKQNIEQLQNIMPQIAKVEADYMAMMEEIKNQPLSSRIIGGTADRLQRQKAVELAGLSAVAQAYQGNVDLARSITQDALSAQFNDQQNYLENLRVQLSSVENDLSREEKRKADALNLVINEREREIEKERELEYNKSELMLALAQNGVSISEIRKVMDAKSYQDAILIASPFLEQKMSFADQLKLFEGGYRFNANGELEVDTSNANAKQIASAIKQIESGGNYEARGASGEYGAYQYMPGTWDSYSSEYAKNVLQISARRLDPTPENQDAVTIYTIDKWLKQGLTPEQIAAKWNSGSEFGWENKIDVNDWGVAYNVPAYVSKVMGALGSQLNKGIGNIDSFTKLEAGTIVTNISPRLANNKELIDEVATLLSQGVSRDDIEDELRYLSQSDLFEPWRNVTNTAFSGVKMTNQQRQANLDVVDDYISVGDNVGALEHIKSTILGNIGATEKKNVTGREDALTSIYEIERLLNEYTSAGGDTGLIKGKVEDINNNVLKRTGNAQLAYIANEIAMAIQKYRQDLTGAAFTESEAKEYERLFPSIGKTPELNRALINSLKSQYERNQRLFWERQLGGVANYNRLQELAGIPIVGVGDLSRFQQPENTQINNYLDNLGY